MLPRGLRLRAVACLGVALAIGVTLPSCSNSISAARDQANIAQQRLSAGDIEGARKAIIRSITIRDDLVESHLLRGRIELQSGRREAAFQAYSTALSLDSTNGEALLAVAQLGLQIGAGDEAESAADQILTLAPNQIDALTVKGAIAVFRRNFDTALEIADRILALDPKNEGGTILKIRTLILSGKVSEANAFAAEARANIGLTSGMALTLLEIYRERSDAANMEAMFSRLDELEASTPDLRLDEINLLYKIGNVTGARERSVRYLEEFKQRPDVLARLTELWRAYDSAPLADATLADIAQHGTLEVRSAVADYELSLGRPQVAQRVLASVATGPWVDIRALNARVLDQLGNSAAATQIAADVLTSDETNFHALLLKAQQDTRSRRYDAAINGAQILIREYPDRPQGYFALIDAYAGRRDTQGLDRVFADAVRALPQNPELFRRYSAYLIARDEAFRAVTITRLFAQQTPALAQAWQLYRAACQADGNSRCVTEAQQGEARSRTIYAIDLPPGAPRGLGLFGRLR